MKSASSARHHPDFLAAYTSILTPRGEAPERFHYWCAVSTIAGALRRRVYIDQGHFRWYPNFYIILVGPPGTVKKSTTLGIGSALLRDLKNIHIGADISTWQSFVEEVAAAKDMFAEGDPDPKQSLEDALMEREHTVTSAITLVISEFGTFFDPDDRAMVNVLTELYDCKVNAAFVKRTKTQGSDTIMNPFVNMIAGTTPDWMRDNFKGRFGGWGLSSRCIFLHCDEPERNVAFPHKIWGDSYEPTMKLFADDLAKIAKLQGRYVFSAAADEYAEAWYGHHRSRQTALNHHAHRDPWLSYYFARKFDHAMKLSIVIAASRRDTLTIELDDIQSATHRCDEIEIELSKVFTSSQATNRDAKLNMDCWNGLSNIIRNDGAISVRRFNAFTIQWMDYGRAKAFLNHLLGSDWLVLEAGSEGGKLTLGINALTAQEREHVSASS